MLVETLIVKRCRCVKNCNQCGKCCIRYSDGGLSATGDEIKFWSEFRPEIARYVDDEKIWMDPVTGDQLSVCPWLTQLPDQKKYICKIYDDRPDDCRHYPVSIKEMIVDECEMLEPKDLARPKYSQKKLNIIMADSRPAYD